MEPWGGTGMYPKDNQFFIKRGAVGFEVLGEVTVKSSVFWDVILCSLMVSQCFRGTYHFHLQGERVSQARNHYKAGLLLASCWFLAPRRLKSV
jgi:hypothetical protein